MFITKFTFLSLVSAGETPLKNKCSVEPRYAQEANMIDNMLCSTLKVMQGSSQIL